MNFQFTHRIRIISIAICCSIIASCNYTKHLTENQTLLKENKVILHADKKIKNASDLESGAQSIISPKPNTHLLDLSFLPKFKLWKYYNKYSLYQKDSTNSKIIKRKVERPVIIDTLNILKSEKLIQQYFFNQGYFYNTVSSKIVPDKKKQVSSVEYDVELGKSYYIKDITFESNSNSLLWVVNKHNKNSILKRGDRFTKINCGNERDRLYKLIRNEGFYDFKTDNISYTIDTVDRTKIKQLLDDPFAQIGKIDEPKKSNDSININMKFLRSKDSSFAQLYTINKIQVEIIDYNYLYNLNLPYIENDLDGIHFKYKTLPINRKVVARNILIQPGSVYNTVDIEATISRLNQLGVFQFVNFRFEKDSTKAGAINCLLELNVSPKMDIVASNDISTSDGYYLLGVGVGLTYKNKNLFHGGNQFSIRSAYSTEFRNDELLTGTKKFYQSGNNVNISSSLIFPKFVTPFNQRFFSKRNLPFTILALNYSYIQRIQNYTVINISGSFGYKWKETSQKSWQVNPSFLTVTKLPDRFLSQTFKDKLEENTYLKNVYANNIIYGENMTFDYISKYKNFYNDFSTLKIGFEEAGTILRGVNYLYKSVSNNSIQPISQYLKLDADYRKYKNFAKMQWINRVMFGIGVPVGASNSLPYIKQYSAGGAFSNRGWRARTLGPGHSQDTSYISGVSILDRTGDLKFEANTELRFDILRLFGGAINLKGATFIDAGNIWLFKKSTDIVGGEFDPNYLWQDISMSGGVGLRFDFSFFVFRLDYAVKMKQPQLLEKSGWAFDQINYKNGVWNIAIGYPF